MGVSATAWTSAFFLPRGQVADALQALHELARREPEEFHHPEAVSTADDFAAALLAGGWRATLDTAGNVVEIRFAGGKAPKESSDLWPVPMFRALSPFVAAAIVEVTFDEAPSTYALLGPKVERWHDEPRDPKDLRRRTTILRKARALVAASRKRAKAPPAAKASKPATKRRAAKPVKVPAVRTKPAEQVTGPRVGMELDMASEEDLVWHRDLRMMASLIEALEPNGLWFDFRRVSLENEDPVRLDPKKLAKAIADWEAGSVELEESDAEELAFVGIDTGGILCRLRLHSPNIDARRKDMLDRIIGWARVAATLIGDRARIRNGSIYSFDLPSDLPEPAREHPMVRLRTLVDFVGIRWSQENVPELMAAALDGPLPAGASRLRYGDLLVLRWLDDPTDPDEHVRASLRQQTWWVEQFPEPAQD